MTLQAQMRSNPRNQVTCPAAGTTTANAIATTQTPASAGPITLNGSLVVTNATVPGSSAPVTNPGGPLAATQILVPSSGLPVTGTAAVLPQAELITLTSAGNDSALVWTINGLDANGSPISETLAGGNATAVTSALMYTQINSIIASAGTAGAITVGVLAAQYSPWLITSHQRRDYQTNIRVFIPGGTANFDVQATSDQNLMEQLGGFADDIVTLAAAQTTNQSSFPNAPWVAYRLKMNSGGPAILRAIESTTA